MFSKLIERRKTKKSTKRRPKLKMYRMLNFQNLSNVEARNHLLANASCYYEFPMLNYSSPPSNSYLDHCMAHAFQKAGFESSSYSGPLQLDEHGDSEGEVPFEGVIRGLEFGSKKNLLMLFGIMALSFLGMVAMIAMGIMFEDEETWIAFGILAGLFFIGIIAAFIVFLIWRKKMPFTATILYWGLNCYDLPKLSDILGQQQGFSGEVRLENLKSVLSYASRFHPRSTILHVCMAFEMKPKRYGSKESVMNKFALLKTKIQEELGLQPVNYEHRFQSQEVNARPLFKWKKTKLKDVEDRFPLI